MQSRSRRMALAMALSLLRCRSASSMPTTEAQRRCGSQRGWRRAGEQLVRSRLCAHCIRQATLRSCSAHRMPRWGRSSWRNFAWQQPAMARIPISPVYALACGRPCPQPGQWHVYESVSSVCSALAVCCCHLWRAACTDVAAGRARFRRARTYWPLLIGASRVSECPTPPVQNV